MPNHDCLSDECLPGSNFDIYRDAHSDNQATLDITNALSPRTSITTTFLWVGKADHASAVNDNLRAMRLMPATGPTLAPFSDWYRPGLACQFTHWLHACKSLFAKCI
jgi:hypothetical protein